jgi:hypothetical protein
MIENKDYKLHYNDFELLNMNGVYLLRNLDNNKLKIGITNNLMRRLNEIEKSFQFCGIIPKLNIECFIEYNNNEILEQYLHKELQEFNYQNEWFSKDNINIVLDRIILFENIENKRKPYIKNQKYRNIYKHMIKEAESKNNIICDDWKEYNNFELWIHENYYKNGTETLRVNKDIIYKNNDIYSPETCLLIPNEYHKLILAKCVINKNLKDKYRYEHKISELNVPLELYDEIPDYNNIYKSQYIYNDTNEAENAGILSKIYFLNELNEIYKDTIPKKIYDTVFNFINKTKLERNEK